MLLSIPRSSYLIRLDDACETLDVKKWQAVERVLDHYSIKPIVAVIAKNEDPTLARNESDESFWDKVKEWERKGWAVAMHGYTHRYHQVDRDKLVLPFYDRSEFAGLELEAQSERLRAAYAIFADRGVYPVAWVAPSHSFDAITLTALKETTSINVVSDGISYYPFIDQGLVFVPQQLWWPRRKLFGTWTICLHPDTMTDHQIDDLDAALVKYNLWKRFITLDDAVAQVKKRSFFTAIYARLFWMRWGLKHR